MDTLSADLTKKLAAQPCFVLCKISVSCYNALYEKEIPEEYSMGMIDRKIEIAQKIKQQGKVNIAALASEYGVSAMTIRRDLARLEKEGLVNVEYGGAVLKNNFLFEFDMDQKQSLYPEEKKRIAQAALDFIQDGDSVFIDAGTTTCEAAHLLGRRSNLKVMTNSLPAANILSSVKDMDLTLCPGKYRTMSRSFLGPLTDEFLSAFHFDVLLLGVEGIEDGIFVPDETDGMTKKKLIRQSKTVICLADHSKFGQTFYYKIAGLDAVDHIITDTGLEKEKMNFFSEQTDFILV